MSDVRTVDDLPDGIRELVRDARVAWHARDYVHARSLLEEALARSVRSGDTFGQLAALHFLGNVAFNERRDVESRALHERALAIATAEGDHHGIATSLGSIALVDAVQGDLTTAESRFRDAIDEYKRAGLPESAARLGQTADALLVERLPVDELVHRV